MLRKKSLYIISASLSFFLSSCQTSPLAVKLDKRFGDGLFSPLSNNVISMSSPVIDSGRLYFGTDKGSLFSYDLNAGKMRWKHKTGSPIEGSVTVHDDKVLFGNSEGMFYCLDGKTGETKWEYATDGAILSRPAVNPEGMVYFTQANGVLNALDLESGEWLWQYKRTQPGISIKGISSPLMVGKDMIVVGFDDGYVSAVDPNSGTLIWERQISKKGRFLDVDADPVYLGGRIFVAGYEEGLFALDRDGNIAWKYEGGGALSKIALVKDDIYFASTGGFIAKLDARSGSKIWRSDFAKDVPSNPVLFGDKVVFGTFSGNIYVASESDGKILWRYVLPGKLGGNILEHKGKIVALVSRGDLFVFKDEMIKGSGQ